ncbi:alpha/beta hydrolase [Rothia uropygioeca]|uniref:alpha/beta hydrolase n=1 Tax=Kocuria sp. 257 TaxID=2021970 RepID=UPI001013B7F0|nr:phospholipase [Kocuria sp. 257]
MTQNPVVEFSRPEAERPGTHLVLMLHGYGSHEKDLLGLLPALPEEGFTYAAMRAPGAMPGGMPGYSWFELQGTFGEDITADAEEVERAAADVIAWIDEASSDYADVTLFGFSQGMAIASSVIRHRPDLACAVVGLSGFVLDSADEFFDDAALAASSPRIPFFYGRDQEDPVIPADMVAFNLDWLRDHTDVTKVLYAGMGHGVSNQEIKHVSEFLCHVLR